MIILPIFVFLGSLALVDCISQAACLIYCSSVNGGPSYNNCSPWISYAIQQNQTCFNRCYNNCMLLEGTCIDNWNYRCCMASKYPSKKPEFNVTGCNRLYNNIFDPEPTPEPTPLPTTKRTTTKKTTKRTTTKKKTTKKTTTKKATTKKPVTTKKATTKKATTKKAANVCENLGNLINDVVN